MILRLTYEIKVSKWLLQPPKRGFFRSTNKANKNANPDHHQMFSESRILGYSAQQIFDIVCNVENYHNFVPWCKKSEVLSRDKNGLTAKLVIGFPPFLGEAYTSHVTFFEPHLVTSVCTDMTLFDHLKTVWKFDPSNLPQSQSCKVDFAVSFQFRAKTHSYISMMFFEEVVKQNIRAFLKEAERIHGPPSIGSKKLKIVMKKNS